MYNIFKENKSRKLKKFVMKKIRIYNSDVMINEEAVLERTKKNVKGKN